MISGTLRSFLLPVFLILAACPAAPAAGEEPVRFVAYNLKNYLKMDRRVDGESRENAPKPETEKAVIVASLVDERPDIIGVCEIGDRADVEDLLARLRAAGLDYPHTELVYAADPTRRLALLSRFPIVERNSQRDLSYVLDDLEIPFSRGILDVTVQVTEDYRLRCVGCHLKSKRPVPEADQALMRRNEAQLLRQHVEGILAADPGVNMLVYGDLNDTRNESPVKAIQGKFGSDTYLWSLYLKDHLGMSWTHHWSTANVYARLDFILVSRGLYPEVDRDASSVHFRKDWEEGSDHRALIAEIVPLEVARP